MTATSYRAMALTAPMTIEPISIPRPDPEPGQVVLKVRSVNLCPTDVKKWHDKGLAQALAAGPLILGHEIAGEVIDCGDGCTTQPGSRVAVDPILRERRENGSEYLKGIGAAAGSAADNIALLAEHGIGGGFAELVAVPEENLIPIPDTVGFGAASLIEPLADIVHGIAKSGDVRGARCAVFGLGPMGLLHVELLAWLGAEVVGVDPREDRRTEARAYGASETVAPGDVPKIDVAYIAAGGPALAAACREALERLNKHGRMIVFASGTKGASLELDLNALHYGNQMIVGVVGFRPEDAAKTIAFLEQGAVDAERIRAPMIGLEDLQEAFARMGRPGTLKYGIDLG